MDEVPVKPRPIEPFASVIGPEATTMFGGALDAAREELDGATVWHVNSTAAGGGVAEMLQTVLSYPADAGISVRWLVIDGTPPFFDVTKRIHHLLHGSPGDGGPLGDHERRVYERTLAGETGRLTELVRAGDVVVLHDPQVLGLAPCLARLGAAVIWSCHIGADTPNDETRRAWGFLSGYLAHTAAQTFSRAQYRWETLAPSTVAVTPPCIDVFATKNRPLGGDAVTAILSAAGIVPVADAPHRPEYVTEEGTRHEVTRRASMVEEHPIPGGVPIVSQVSRWDPLKDHAGLMHAFTAHVPPDGGAHLLLVGPAPGSVDDDPEANDTFEDLIRSRNGLAPDQLRRVHVCPVPMDDPEENAAIVNAIQRRSDVVVQKSLAEGFGLTVAEAMWKGRPTVGSRVGGIQDQIRHGESGLLVDPDAPSDVGSAITRMLADPALARRMGEAARRYVGENHLAPSYLSRQFALVRTVR